MRTIQLTSMYSETATTPPESVGRAMITDKATDGGVDYIDRAYLMPYDYDETSHELVGDLGYQR